MKIDAIINEKGNTTTKININRDKINNYYINNNDIWYITIMNDIESKVTLTGIIVIRKLK